MTLKIVYATRSWVPFAVMAMGLFLCSTSPSVAGATTAFSRSTPGSAVRVDHSLWDSLLKQYVKTGSDGVARVNYQVFKDAGRASLTQYLEQLQAVDVAALDRPEQFAFWANLYNAKTIDVVVAAYPVASIKDINLGGGLLAAVTGGPWKAKILRVGGADLSLDDVEHKIMRPVFGDPRVHYALNCASVGCPNLGPDAFTGDRLESQLDAAARAYVTHPRAVRIEDGGVVVSSIYSWFQSDFGGSPESVLAHLRRYGDERVKRELSGATDIARTDYDWSLNDHSKP